jgi:ATP-dependent DNA ligase
MLARAASSLPSGSGWLYEPKWDGFRALVYRDDDGVHVMSRNGKTLTDYFPDITAVAKQALPGRCVVDGELVVLDDHGRLDFEGLLGRLNPRQSEVGQARATFVAFDLLALGGRDLRPAPFAQRRRALERALQEHPRMAPTPQTDRLDAATAWLHGFRNRGIEGVVAKRRDLRYLAGQRLMIKVRARRSLDCVVGGVVPDRDGLPAVLLLGLYAEDGVLDHVGQSAALPPARRVEAQQRLAHHMARPSFVGGLTPGHSRWTEQRNVRWVSVRPVVVCEVAYTAVDGARLGHSAAFERWREDRSAEGCRGSQLQ